MADVMTGVSIVLNNIKEILTYITAIGLVLGIFKYFLDERDKKSLFYLQEIKSNFEKATRLITEGNNNNIVWHSAIHLLKAGQTLSRRLAKKHHQKIYMDYYIHTCYSLCQVVALIDSLKFFYGMPDYTNKEAAFLFQESFENNRINTFSHTYREPPAPEDDKNCRIFRICPQLLSYFIRFLVVCNKYEFRADKNYFFNPIPEKEMSQQEASDYILSFRLIALYILDFQARADYTPEIKTFSFPQLMSIR